MTSVRDTFSGTLVLSEAPSVEQLARFDAYVEPLTGAARQMLHDGAFGDLGLGGPEDVEETLKSLEGERRPIADRPVDAVVLSRLVIRIARYVNKVDPNEQTTKILDTTAKATKSPTGDSDSAIEAGGRVD